MKLEHDDAAIMCGANTALKVAAALGKLPGLIALLSAAARFAERNGIDRAVAHLLLDAAYRISAEDAARCVDPTAPLFRVRAPKPRVTRAARRAKARAA